MPYASLACDMTSASEVAVAAWGALQVLYAFAFISNGVCWYILSLVDAVKHTFVTFFTYNL